MCGVGRERKIQLRIVTEGCALEEGRMREMVGGMITEWAEAGWNGREGTGRVGEVRDGNIEEKRNQIFKLFLYLVM